MKLPFGWELVRVQNLSGAPDNPFIPHATVRRTNALTGGLERKAGEPNLQGLGGRKSKDNLNTLDGVGFWNTFAQQKKANAHVGLNAKLDLTDFENMDINSLTELMADVSPEFSKALWDYLLLANSGYSIRCYPPDQVEGDEDEVANAAMKEITDEMSRLNGTLGVWFDRLFKMMFFRGSFLLELVLADDARTFVDVATPDTKTLDFKRKTDPQRGQYWTFGQKINGKFVDLGVYPTIKYIPIHPAPDSIEGTPMGTSALFLAIFLMAVLRDVKRVVQHQGYLRLDVQVEFEKLRETIPQSTRDDPEKLTSWMQDAITQVQQVYETLDPDDTYVHGDSITINNPVGTVSADALEAIDSLFNVLERMAVRALKTMPILLATNANRTETQANREWEIYAKGVETIQHFVESACEHVFKLALQAQGILCNVKVRFETFRAAEKMRDAQVDYLITKLARMQYDCGIISMEKMAQMCGYKDADADEPRQAMAAGNDQDLFGTNANPNEGEERASTVKRILELIRMPTSPQAQEATDFLKQYAPDVLARIYDADIEVSGAPDNILN